MQTHDLRQQITRQNINRRGYVKGQNTLLEREAYQRGGWRNYDGYYLSKFGGDGSVARMGSKGTIVGS